MTKSKRAKVATKVETQTESEFEPWTVDQLLETIDLASLSVHFAPDESRAFVSFEIPMARPLAWFMTGALVDSGPAPSRGTILNVSDSRVEFYA